MAENEATPKPFGGKRFSRLKDAETVSVGLNREVIDGLDKLAYRDCRNRRDLIRRILTLEVQRAIKEGEITLGPLVMPNGGSE